MSALWLCLRLCHLKISWDTLALKDLRWNLQNCFYGAKYMDDYFITKFARQIISIIKRMGGKLLLVVLWVCSCVFEKLIKIQSAMPSRSFRRPTTLLLKVIYPKYYKHSNESCTFVVYGQIGPSGRYWICFLKFG